MSTPPRAHSSLTGGGGGSPMMFRVGPPPQGQLPDGLLSQRPSTCSACSQSHQLRRLRSSTQVDGLLSPRPSGASGLLPIASPALSSPVPPPTPLGWERTSGLEISPMLPAPPTRRVWGPSQAPPGGGAGCCGAGMLGAPAAALTAAAVAPCTALLSRRAAGMGTLPASSTAAARATKGTPQLQPATAPARASPTTPWQDTPEQRPASPPDVEEPLYPLPRPISTFAERRASTDPQVLGTGTAQSEVVGRADASESARDESSPSQPRMRYRAGERLRLMLERAGYEIDPVPLHRGRHGAVVLQATAPNGVQCAAKLLTNRLELEAMRLLKGNPHAAELIASGSSVPSWLAVRLYPAGDAARWLRRHAEWHGPEGSKRVGGHIATALAQLHAASLCHLDIKLDNVLIDGDPSQPILRLADFGLCSHVNDPADPADGDGRYLCRSFLVDKSPALRRPADIYALGCCMLEVLAFAKRGRQFKLPGQYDQRSVVAAELLANAALMAPEQELAEALHGCLSSDPFKRPTARSIAERLGEPGLPPCRRTRQCTPSPPTSPNTESPRIGAAGPFAPA
eukprot:TRINITY_DN1926_c2_g1_i2.p1 TRINITY_DN1926_c2_g1~~TRINITY_DN1926_c2_g1_i2.p1  ORF type:complete len:570 (+),score=101.04 TRINITY_DN1926_c2_g1_i2:81-1790(+)